MWTLLLLCIQLPPQQNQPLDLRALLTAPRHEVARERHYTFERERTRRLPGAKADVSDLQHLQFTQEVLRVDADGKLASLLRFYNKAVHGPKEKTVPYAHQGKWVLFTKKNDGWVPQPYELVEGDRKDLRLDPRPLKHEALLLHAPERAHEVFLASLPEAPLKEGSTWPLTVRFLGDALESLEGLDMERSKLTLTLVKFGEERLDFALKGMVYIQAGDKKSGALMNWAGKITGELQLARGPYQELLRRIEVDETVTVSQGEHTVTGKGTLKILRKLDRDHQN